jgi:hypothetical protein
LQSQPTGTVTVSIASSDSDVVSYNAVVEGTIIFTTSNYHQVQSVRLNGTVAGWPAHPSNGLLC